MDLMRIPGIGPEDVRRLVESGVADASALAHAQDLSTLAVRTGIPPARLATFQAVAFEMGEDAGIAIQTVAPFQEVAQTLWRAVEDAQDDARGRVEALRGAAMEAAASVRTATQYVLAGAQRDAARALAGLRQAASDMGRDRTT